jgi:exo-beta-1,3-glucanase (GH17 family)
MPTKAQIREDLHILDPHFSYIRVYASNRPDTRTVLEVIKEDQLNIKMVLGAWLQCEKVDHYAYKPEHGAINDKEIATAISLAKEFPDTIVAITVGNEILVDWSFWPVPLERVISLVRKVQQATGLPVSVADDYSAWATPGGVALAEVTDFVFLHTHPIWHKQDIDTGFQDFLKTFQQVRDAVGPDKRLIVGETGWATLTTPNDKEPLHAPGAGSEEKQALFWHQRHNWAIAEGTPIFWFSAFDEPWKDSEGTEGFWGIYTVERQPKALLNP